jgi:hypothetical protein
VLIPVVVSNREIERYQNKHAIWFNDNSAAHYSDDIFRKPAYHRILVLIYPHRALYLF